MAYLQGFEPRTHGLEGHCSIQLSYRYMLQSPKSLILRWYQYLTKFAFREVSHLSLLTSCVSFMERVKGIEPSQSAWKAEVLPLNYTRKWWREKDSNLRSLWQQIYSLPPLATREPLRVGCQKSVCRLAGPTSRKPYTLPSKSLALRLPVWSWWWDSNP